MAFPGDALPGNRDVVVADGVMFCTATHRAACGAKGNQYELALLVLCFILSTPISSSLPYRRQLPGPGRNQLRFGHQSEPVQPLVLQQSLLPLLPHPPLVVQGWGRSPAGEHWGWMFLSSLRWHGLLSELLYIGYQSCTYDRVYLISPNSRRSRGFTRSRPLVSFCLCK